MAEHNDPPIIRIVKKGHGHGHHGGAWKVAFADFVTAMMALFIVLWILGQSEDVKRGIGGYFRDPTGKALLGAGPSESISSSNKSMIKLPTVMERYSMPDPVLESEADRLEEVIEQSEALRELKDQISIEVTQEGLRLEINEGEHDPLFESGSAEMTPKLRAALAALANEYKKLPYKIIVEGHTDATPYRSVSGMTNWELSTQRANQARNVLEEGGLPDDQVLMVRGFADRRPRFDDPLDPRNRRISMLLVSSQGMDIALGKLNFAGIEDSEIPATPPETKPKRNRVTLFRDGEERLMGSNYRSRVVYLLHPDERSAPPILEQAAEVRVIRRGHEPDLSIKQFDASAIVIGPPMDHDAHIALDRMATLMLPVLGLGTGPNERLICDVSVTIALGDLRSIISLLGSPATLCSLPPGHGANGLGTWLKHSADNFAQMMEHLLALRMPDYRDRAERVVQACLWIGSHLGMGGEELNTLQLAARMREIGKLGLPDKILFTPREQRTQDEQSMYDRYPMLGSRVLQQFPLFIAAAKIVEHHLENFDGSGAMGLASHQIPLGSRILRVAGAFQMISDTGTKGREEVIHILGRGRGSLYDPMLVGLVENYATLATSPLNAGAETRRVRLSDLVEGMILAEDIWSRTGVKIVGSGTRLNEHIIRILMTLPLNMAIESVEIQRDNLQ